MMRGAALVLLAWLLALIASPAMAQQGVTLQAFTPTGGTSGQPVTNVSARTALPSADPHLLVINSGANAVHYKLGDGSVTATTSDPVLEPMAAMPVAVGSNTNIAYLTESSTSTLYLIQGTGGPPNQFIGSSGSAGGGTSSSFAAAFPATGTAIGAKNGANMVNLTADGSNNLNVNCASGCGVSSFADQGAFTFGSTSINTIGGVYSASPTPLTSGTAGVALLTQGRILETASFASNGVEIGSTLRSGFSPPLQVNQSPLLALPGIVPPIRSIGDGKNIASFAGPNTVADASKPALVTALSPTTPLPAGTNAIGAVTQSGTWNSRTQDGSGTAITSTTAALDVNLKGNTFGTLTISGSVTDSVTTWGGGTLGAMANYGSSPGAVLVPGVNAFITNVPAVTINAGTASIGKISDVTNIETTVAPGTAPSNAAVAGCVYNTLLPAPTNGQTLAVQCSNAGLLFTQTTLYDAAGQELGASRQNVRTVPLQTAQTPPLAVPPPFLTSRMLSDGRWVASFAAPNTVADASKPALVTALSPNTPLPSGTNTLGAVTQSSGPWSENITQFGSNAVVTGTGASGSGIPRVTVANDSNVLATQSTSPWVTQDRADGSVTPGSAGAVSMLGGCIYNSSLPAPTNGQQLAIQCNNAGLLFTQNTWYDAAGREMGSLRRGVSTTPVQVNITPTLIPPQPPIFTPLDTYGRTNTASWITDGKDYASVTSRGMGPKSLDSALVVTNSLVPALMCPYQAAVSQTSNTKVVAGQAGKFIHVCSYKVISATAQSVALIEGTGTTCGTGTGNLDGQTTSGSIALAANGGFQTGTSTAQVVIPMQKGGDDLCIAQSGAGNVSGYVNYGIFN